MPVYDYKALDGQAKTIAGIVDADSRLGARQKLQGQGLFPVTIEESREIHTPQNMRRFKVFNPLRRIRPAELGMMTRQLATLMGAGFPLVSALEAVISQTESARLKTVLAQLREKIVEGQSLAEALQAYPGVFSAVYINMIRAGEASGTLELVMERLADISEKQEAMKSRIRAAMTYPILMLLLGSAILFFLMTHVVPNITGIFTEMQRSLPTPTRILIDISNFLQNYLVIIILVLPVLAIGLRQLHKTEKGRRVFDQALFKLPVISGILKKLSAARFAQMLGSLIENGIPMLNALQVVRGITDNRLFGDAIDKAADDVSKGQGLAQTLRGVELIPPLAVQMIEVGEQSGELEKMLAKVADFYERQLEDQLLGLTSLMEPLMIVVMGLIIGFIVLSICLPIFEMNQLII
ncbi:MAG: type II secretion system inner membrane protein GspF [Desulfobacterales bacterium]|nr:type II secretion system inner membrane protein GspF [Desulfobacterales bacterium]